jgi:hypothetical protein
MAVETPLLGSWIYRSSAHPLRVEENWYLWVAGALSRPARNAEEVPTLETRATRPILKTASRETRAARPTLKAAPRTTDKYTPSQCNGKSSDATSPVGGAAHQLVVQVHLLGQGRTKRQGRKKKKKGRANLKERRAARVYAKGPKEKEHHASSSHAKGPNTRTNLGTCLGVGL